MKNHLRCLGAEVCEITKNGYTPHDPNSRTPTHPDEQKRDDNDVREKEVLLSALSDEKLLSLIQLKMQRRSG